jgi:beta-aspartyl-peptidase (threonine type)
MTRSTFSIFTRTGFVAVILLTSILGFAWSATRREPVQSVGKWGIVVHGGAGVIDTTKMSPERRQLYRDALVRALNAGHRVLASGGRSLDAVQAAIVILEDDSLFNAGKGAVFNAQGKNELDASLMDGRTHNVGAVAELHHIKNPILLARLVMDKSPHVMMVGEGAEVFARQQGVKMVPERYFYTGARWKAYVDSVNKLKGKGPTGAVSPEGVFGTVGAVALDKSGNLAAGTSTGGILMKRYGRIGDSPIIGAGTYADSTCAVSATGDGEYFIRFTVARDICARAEFQKLPINQAADSVIFGVLSKTKGTGGVIVLDSHGNFAMTMNSKGMYRGYMGPDGKPTVAIMR